MEQENEPIVGYDFTDEGGENNVYIFVTENKIVYQIDFRPTFYFFGQDSIYSHYTYELIIKVLETPLGRPPFDARTARTIATIFDDFYQKYSETVTIYICDSSDGRQWVRSRKFHLWFSEFQKTNYSKYDSSFVDSKGIYYPTSLIFHIKNSFKYQIIQEFDSIIDGYNSEK